MQSIKRCVYFVLFLTLAFPVLVSAQAVDTVATDDNQIIELGAKEIKIAIEAPQVKLLTNRIKPEFDEIHLDKSFLKEIVGEGEKFSFRSVEQAKKPEEIDIEKLINKRR